MPEDFNILVSCAGRRVGLVRYFQQALRGLGLTGVVAAADLDFSAPACHVADRRFTAPLFSSGTFIDDMLGICERERIRLVIPTIDTELPYYAGARERFEAIGTTVAISSPKAIEIGGDKQQTHAWLDSIGVPVPRQTTVAGVLASPGDWPVPLIAKPARGSSSIGLRHVTRHAELSLIDKPDTMVVEAVATGDEYTIDVYIDRSGRARCAVPRKRLATRSGEVSKGHAVRDAMLQSMAMRVGDALPGGFGVINVQIFYDPASGEYAAIEINPRFGGGFPLAHEAGMDCPRWLIQECLGRDPQIEPDAWRDGLVMLRYDEAVFVDQSEVATG